MQFKPSQTLTLLPLVAALYSPATWADNTDNVSGTWDSLTLSGNLGSLSPSLSKFSWLVMNQTRTRDDSNQQGMRVSENLLFSQLGYNIDPNFSVWLGYVHDWIHPLDKTSYQESRPYQDVLWKYSISDLKLTARLRLEQRIRQDTGDVGIRTREMLQMSYPLAFVDKNLSAYVGDEVLEYTNQNTFGRTGFSENRVMAGFSYQITDKLGADLGYLGQYVQNISAPNLFTHNAQVNLSYKF